MLKKNYLRLSSPVKYIKGIGPKRALYFKKMGIETVEELLYLIPRRYLDYSNILLIKDLKVNDEATIIGQVLQIKTQYTRKRGNLLKVLIADRSDKILIKWFNRPDLKKKFKVGDWLLISGKVSFYYGRQLINPLYEIISEEDREQKNQGTIIPIYPQTEGLNSWSIRRAVKIVLENCIGQVKEILPESILKKNKLMPLYEALGKIHLPQEKEEANRARRRLVYDEFFFFELILAKRKTKLQNEPGIAFRENGRLTKKFLSLLPFKLTSGQCVVINKIAYDMAQQRPMNRLLQGDVGSGKTVVAIYAMLIAVENNYQSALMAPTELLAEQHYFNLKMILQKLGINCALLTSSVKTSEKEIILKKLNQGEVKIIFGTHALIEGNINFQKLGLVVIDEQHRFGVMQRAALLNKGINPDFLVLSATPIPRTLALTLYGDLDISLLEEKPPQRGEVITKIIKPQDRNVTFKFIAQELAKKRQAFVICPIIEKSEKLDLKSVNEVYTEINALFPNNTVGLIHGHLKTTERMKIMNDFRNRHLDILISTTVIEVGVDIPNASIMIIEHPERFGLAQLHQLRGRIGRGSQKSYCFLFLNRFVTTEAFERILFFAQTNDGFALAQKDMKLRGPGEILGKKQHGLPDIKIGDLEKDRELLFKARDDAFELIKMDPKIELPQHYMIKNYLQRISIKEDLLRIG